jgi:transglutaminase-like putative cysteine protease
MQFSGIWCQEQARTLSLVSEMTRFYRQPSPTSDLGRHAGLSPGLPADPEALSAIVRGLLIHNYAAKVQGLTFPAGRMAHMQTVGAEAILDNVFSLDPAPLGVERPAGRRMVGFCYHFALLHCALLRATGTPSRIRCGFAGYFEPQRWIDHWVTEYWDGDRWLLTDPQIGRRDLTSEDFQDGLTAWNRCRGGASTPDAYGNGELWGWDELRGSLINDVAALGKVEVSGWYWCDRLKVESLDQPHDELDTSLDILSRLAATAESAEMIKECLDRYPDLQPPADAVAR